MRTIRFRGKRTDDGEFVYGYYVEKLYSGTHHHLIITTDGEECEVDPDTVGEYTTMKDNNGTKIYEGDIVDVDDWTSVYRSPYTGYVTWGRGSQWLVNVIQKTKHMYIRGPYPLEFDDFADKKTKVVGNIYDNPELLSKIGD